MKNKVISRLVIFGVIAIVGILAMQVYWISSLLEFRKQELDQSTKIALFQVAKDLARARKVDLPTNTTIQVRGSNTYQVNINDVIDAGLLEFFLRKEFNNKGIKLDFEYAIHDCNSNEVVYGGTVYLSKNSNQSSQIKKLPRYSKFLYYFSVRFHSTNKYILSSIQLPIIFTAVLIFILLVFSYSLIFILRQRRLSQMQKDFINNMTHEFKTPISTIKISAEVFLNNESIKKDKRLARYANIILEQSQRLNDQVEKVLQVAKLEKNTVELDSRIINLHNLLESVVESFELRIHELSGKIDLKLNVENPSIQADSLHLINVLNSLIDNAIKYSKDAPSITVLTCEDNHFIYLKVQDLGIGIAKEDQNKIFQKFYRVPTGDIHDVKGFGLGLFYVQSICKAHGWALNVQSEKGKGTTFTISFKKQHQ